MLSILDRSTAVSASADAFVLASSFAELAEPWLTAADVVIRLAPLLLQAVAGAVRNDVDLAAALHAEAAKAARDTPERDLGQLAAVMAAAADVNTATLDAAVRMMTEFLSFAKLRRAR